MENFSHLLTQEIIFSSSDYNHSKAISKLEKKGKLKKIASRLFTSNLTEEPSDIIRRNLFQVLAGLYPGAVLSHRSAIEFQPTEEGHIFLSYQYTRKITLPGLTVRLLEGPSADEGDNQLFQGLFVASKERAILENLQVSRRKGPQSKSIGLLLVEEQLETYLQVHGEEGLNQFRDKARIVAEKFDWKKPFEKLDKLISALLNTHSSNILRSPRSIARVFGIPYDADRLDLFNILFVALQRREFPSRREPNTDIDSFNIFAFFEAYFSNFIEGTVFEVDEAREVIRSQRPITARNEDSHDILGTYKICSDPIEMSITPDTPESLIALLKTRHQVLLKARTNKDPGKFKMINNRAGQTQFVNKELVVGTLHKGFQFYQGIQHPFAKSIFMMFLISEVHPFLDGNGRIARIMMNAELVAENQAKIIIPTVFRDDYLLALRRLSRRRDPEVYINMFERAYDFSKELYYDDFESFEKHLVKSEAFLEHTEGKLRLIKNLNS